MSNKYGIPEEELNKIRARDKRCVYCHKEMLKHHNKKNQGDSPTIEHLNSDPPFYWKDGLKIEDVAICCGSCNSSRGIKKLSDWFTVKFCKDRKINGDTVAGPVKEYLKRNPCK